VAWPTPDGVCAIACTIADEAPPLLPQRRPGAEPSAEPAGPGGFQGANPPRALPDLNVLRQVLAGLRRLD
jgi:hypothetical protein